MVVNLDFGADEFAEKDDDDEKGHGEESIDDAHHDGFGFAADVSGDAAVNDAKGDGEGGGNEGDEEGNLSTFKDSHKEVAPELVGAQKGVATGTSETAGEVLRRGVVPKKGKEGREDVAGDENANDGDATEQSEFVFLEADKGVGPERGSFLGFGHEEKFFRASVFECCGWACVFHFNHESDEWNEFCGRFRVWRFLNAFLDP